MAKEMMIVFVYDTQCCVSEEDDPAEAVLYFHPGWVSDTQRHALAGQVVGAAHCVKSLFSQPVAITLQSGKFILREYGRYVLAIGSDRNIPDWVLKNRASLLTSMIKVYHGDLNMLAAQMEDQKRLAEKLYQVFETYLPVLQYGCHIFQRVPMLSLPKSATSVYMESMQILEHCRKSKGVLGGVILYNNKNKTHREDTESDSESESNLDLLPEYSQHAVKCALFVSGLQNMALLALLEVDAADNVDTINNLWETSLNALGPIEQKCMEPLPAEAETTDYSYLMLDPDWGSVRKGGPWAAMDIATMGQIHNEFAEDPELSEFILSINIFGDKCRQNLRSSQDLCPFDKKASCEGTRKRCRYCSTRQNPQRPCVKY